MQYNFDKVIDRRNSNSYKWDSADAEGADYPLWVADMDWRAAEPILEALRRRVEHGVFGYVTTPDSVREVVCRWFRERHRWTILPSQITVAPGVVPTVSAILRTYPGKRVVMNTPNYNCFFDCIRAAGCTLIDSPLILQDAYYTMDLADLETKLQSADIFLFCNPHNPTGRVWTAQEVKQVAELCARYDVLVLTDEIHGEFAWHAPYTPLATVAPDSLRWIAMTSATKAFNIAGLQFASIVSRDEHCKAVVDSALSLSHLEDINPFGQVATVAAYEHCADWLDQMNRYVESNYDYLCRWYAAHKPDCVVTRMDGTYLAWVDYRRDAEYHQYGTTEMLCHHWVTEHGVKFNPGEMYGAEGFVRINLACPRIILENALNRQISKIGTDRGSAHHSR